MTESVHFVCAGCGYSCTVCDLETEVKLTHCTECANKRISELEATIERVRWLLRRWVEDNSLGPDRHLDVYDHINELKEALADD